MSKKKNWPCTIDAGRVKQCWALDEVLQLPGGRGTRSQGVEAQTMVNMDSFEFSRNLIVLKSGEHGKKGLVMNLCPFCGGELVEGVKAKLAEKAASKPLPQGLTPDAGAK
jgi:hypothetical protein